MASNGKGYNLARRSHRLALTVRRYVSGRRWPRVQQTDLRYLLRSSGAVAAHFIEAAHASGRGDFPRRIAIAREEAAETMLWLEILAETSSCRAPLRPMERLHEKAGTLNRALSSILRDEN